MNQLSFLTLSPRHRPTALVMNGPSTVPGGSTTSAAARSGISLLEVVLALSILAVAAAYLAQSTHLASENAIRAQTLTQAELVAESVMNQIVAGLLPAQPTGWTPFAPPNPLGAGALAASHAQWLYQIQNVGSEMPGMVGVQVGVVQARPGRELTGQPDLYINRWIIDPSLGLDMPSNSATLGSMGGAP